PGERLHHLPICFRRKLLNDCAIRPSTCGARTPRAVAPGRLVRVDAAREQCFELWIDAWPTQRLFDERVETERRQMTLVKHDRMPQRDRPAVVAVVHEEIEQGVRSGAILLIRADQRLTIERRRLCDLCHRWSRV